MALTRPSEIKRKKGSMNPAGTKKWDGTKWVPVNVKRDGQRATLNGKPVIRKNGEWVPYKAPQRGYNPVQRKTPPKTKPTKTKPPKATPLKTIPDKDRPNDMRAGRVYGDAGQPPAPTLPPRPSRTRSSSTTTPTKPTKTRTPQSSDMSANMRAWAKAHPELAKKVKKGQSGYKDVQTTADPSSSTPTANKPKNRSADWISNNFKPGNRKETTPAKTKRKKNRSASWIARNYTN